MQANVRSAAAVAQAVKVAVLGGASVYALSNSIFNVEGGHRAIIFNRVVGIKDEARRCARSRGQRRGSPLLAHCRCMRRAHT
jgi:hypothetical protein